MIKVCVVGSLNMDLVVKVPRLPRVGETVSGGTFTMFPGGKGANQAVAAARLGAQVTMVGRVGRDAFGQQLVDGLRREGIDVAHVWTDPDAATGVAFIGIDGQGRNAIVVAPGANMCLVPADVDEARSAIAGADVLLLQLEVPVEVVMRAVTIAKAGGALVCLDPAPAVSVPDALYAQVDILNPNEIEAQTLTGVEFGTELAAEPAARVLRDRGTRIVVLKLGARGAFYISEEGSGFVPAVPVVAVDTTAAGDAFAAALGVALARGSPLPGAVRFATQVAGIKVTRMGAQTGMPTRAEVEEAMRQ